MLKNNSSLTKMGLKIGLVVPIYNEAQLLPQLLKSVSQQDCSPEIFITVFVVYSRTNDNSQKIIKRFFAQHHNLSYQLLKEKKRGIHYARKRGLDWLAKQQIPILASTDADAILPKNFISNINHVFKNKSNLVLIGRAIWPLEFILSLKKPLLKTLNKLRQLSLIEDQLTGHKLNGAYYALTLKQYQKIGGLPIDASQSTDDVFFGRDLFFSKANMIFSQNVVTYSPRRLLSEPIKYMSSQSYQKPFLKHYSKPLSKSINIKKSKLEKLLKANFKRTATNIYKDTLDIYQIRLKKKNQKVMAKKQLLKIAKIITNQNYQKFIDQLIKSQQNISIRKSIIKKIENRIKRQIVN